MGNVMNFMGVLGMLLAYVIPSLFVLYIAVWFANRNERKRGYLRRVERKYSISPLFGESRQTLLRAQHKRPA